MNAMVEAPMEAHGGELALPGTRTTVAFHLPENTTFDKWMEAGEWLLGLGEATRWWLGDWLAFGERVYGEKYAQALDSTGLDYQTLRNLAWVANKVKPEQRHPALRWSHHEVVAKLEPEQQAELLSEAAEKQLTRDDFRKLVKERHAVARDPSELITASDCNDWGTPQEFITAVREVLGDIELDPASSAFFNQVVQAKRILTIEDDAMKHEWVAGTSYMNPPFGRAEDGGSQAGDFCDKFIGHFEAGDIGKGIIHVNPNTAQRWFLPLWKYDICWPIGRISHYNANGPQKSPTHASIFVSLGCGQKFVDVFSTIGPVTPGWHRPGGVVKWTEVS